MGKQPRAPVIMRMRVNVASPKSESSGFTDTSVRVRVQALAQRRDGVVCVDEGGSGESEREITNPLDALASQGRGQSQPRGFTTLDREEEGARTRVPDQQRHQG